MCKVVRKRMRDLDKFCHTSMVLTKENLPQKSLWIIIARL